MIRTARSTLLLLLAVILVPPAFAQGGGDTTRILSADGWDAFAYAEKNAKVCYLVGQPEKSDPAGLKRGRVDLYVTHRPAEKALDVVHFDVGYAFKPGSSADLDVDGKKFQLFTDKDSAWDPDAATDKTVAETLAKGKHATLKGVSGRGTATTDVYALGGFNKAIAAIDKACGVKR